MESETAEQNRKARQREYYLKHREKMLAYSRRYLQEHPEKRKLYQKMQPGNEQTAQDITSVIISATRKDCWQAPSNGTRITPKR